MARLEYIAFTPWREALQGGQFAWAPDRLARPVKGLPQVFWAAGEGWAEVNLWAIEKVSTRRIKVETIRALMKHLHAYAEFLEPNELDWRHFPVRLADRALVLFRGALMDQISRGGLASSTAKARMSAVIQFYRYADANGFVRADSPMWTEKSVVVPYYDCVGFKRAMTRVVTDLGIPNRSRPGIRLEGGLFPLSQDHMKQLLDFTSVEATQELHLMLSVGFFTGARVGTINSIRIKNLEQARPDPLTPGFFLMRVGPGTGVATKFDIEGNLLVPDFLLSELKRYAYSTQRLKREAMAEPSDQSLVFLSKRGNKFSVDSIGRLIIELRGHATRAGLRFMAQFKFHMTRATYGTWLMQLALGITTVSAAIEFVKSAMMHKHESTTFTYVKFLENSKGKQEVASAFHQVFTGLSNRNWNRIRA